jgi:hypothetical protein
MTFLRVIIAALAWMAAGIPRAIAEEEPCSKPVAGAVREPGYAFGYGWWFEVSSAEHILVRCVLNQSAERALFINWPGAGLQGFARPNSSMYVKEVHRDEQQEEYQDHIWYGANLRRLDIIAVRHPSMLRGPDPSHQHGHRIQPLAIPVAVRSTGTSPLEQSSRIAVPVVPLQGEPDRNRAYLEATPNALGDLEFNFDSRVISAESGLLIENHCTYALRGNNTHARPRLLISIEDPTLAQSLFGAVRSTEVRSWTRAARPEFRASSTASDVSLGTTRLLVSATTPAGPVLVATLPIAFFVDR